jgi:hypothetical protein
MGTQDKDLTGILKKYLSHVVYVDDEFKIPWQLSGKESAKRPPRRSRRKETDADMEPQQEEEKEKGNLESFCEFAQEHYPEILLTPILYKGVKGNDNLHLHMKNARLLILDWNLTNDAPDKVTAVNLLEDEDFSGQLRFCVIYTSNLPDAKKEFVEKMPFVKGQGLEKRVYKKAGTDKERTYEYVRADSVIYMLCEKDKFDFDMIINALTEIFIDEIGYFPIAFIDMISRLEEKVPDYLNKFSHPFDKLLLLQTSADGLPLVDVYGTISNMVMNNIRSDIDLDTAVLENIYEKQIHQIDVLVQDREMFQERLSKSLPIIRERLECDEKSKEIVCGLKPEEYREIIKKAISTPGDLTKGIVKASVAMAKLCGERKAEKMLAENGISEESCGGLKKELSQSYRRAFEEKMKKILPVCLMILTAPEQSYNINNLITSLKTVSYEDKKQRFSQIFEKCYEKEDKDMCLKSGEDGKMSLALLQNKLCPGDIFFRKNAKTRKIDACYLCIVPACHLLRPKKVEGNIVFVKGEIAEGNRQGPLKHSEHLTILPDPENENTSIHVIWKYHSIQEIDLKKIAVADYEALYRPYRLTYEYIRQIVGEFVSFYSKSGVEELFLKSDVSLERLLMQE